jgi:hypothetical protein
VAGVGAEPDAVPHVVVHVVTSKVAPLASPRARSPRTDHQPIVRRARWNPPTRWQHERPRRHFPQFIVLLMLAAFAVLCVELGWIDLERWRQLLADYI